MGVLNITPDSFYDGGFFENQKKALQQVEKMLAEGADIIDVGGYSSRPGATDISEAEETSRVIPVITDIISTFPSAIISIDTFRSAIASQAIDAGASIINDISGGEQDPNMFATVARLKVPYVLMHMKGTPQTMTTLASYDNLIRDMVQYFQQKIAQLHALGVTDIIVDPGFGFAKTVEQNFEILNHFDHFKILGQPLLAGLSRKSMIWRTLKIQPQEALNGTTALNTVALQKGASILRVHDVKEAMEAIQLTSYLQ
ncbi:MAG: dihydropteroate synthase [Cyclobacteriaceae bacterium]|nr:dihydropteroate synthase [Cyclobacteriaceae bacterium]